LEYLEFVGGLWGVPQAKAGIDPLHKLIDKVPDDNVAAIAEEA
jgi:hypothetical protein